MIDRSCHPRPNNTRLFENLCNSREFVIELVIESTRSDSKVN